MEETVLIINYRRFFFVVVYILIVIRVTKNFYYLWQLSIFKDKIKKKKKNDYMIEAYIYVYYHAVAAVSDASPFIFN